MNRIFRVIFNQSRGEYIVSSEHSRSRGKSGKLKSACLAAGLIAAMGLLPLQASAATGTRIAVGKGEIQTLTGETFQSLTNTTEDKGYGGAIYNQGTLTVSGSTFGGVDDEGNSLGNTAKNGGAIFNNEGAELTISNSSFTSNKATLYGGAIINNKGTAIITGTTFSSNNSEKRGGAIYVSANSSVSANTIIEKSIFTDNSTGTDGAGGALFFFNSENSALENSMATITGSTFSKNKSEGIGGSIYLQKSILTIENSIFSNNVGKYGGAIDAKYSDLTIKGSNFSDNIYQKYRDYKRFCGNFKI